MKAISVNPLHDYKLQVSFDDGVSGIISLKDFIKNGIFSVLQNEDFFKKVYTNGYSVAWSDELEIDTLAIYAEILKKNPEDIIAENFSIVEKSAYDAEFVAKIQKSREQVKIGETRVVNIADL